MRTAEQKKAYDREYYYQNREARKAASSLYNKGPGREKKNASNAAARKALRAKFSLLKVGRPCYDCGGMFPPECMDWDHIDQSKKRFEVSWALSNSRPADEIIEEIDKCQLVCACCHRIRTTKQRSLS